MGESGVFVKCIERVIKRTPWFFQQGARVLGLACLCEVGKQELSCAEPVPHGTASAELVSGQEGKSGVGSTVVVRNFS